jgi:alpha-tubulin suppressor-like RCC1 family protein
MTGRSAAGAKTGEVGDGTTTTRASPVPVLGVRNAVAVATGGNGFSAALLADGTVMTWGNALAGALGRTPAKTSTPSPTPAPVPGAAGIRAIAAGLGHMLALTEAGTIVSWGDDTFGSHGRGADQSPAPRPIRGLSDVRSIVARDSTSLAVLGSGRIMTWGTVRPWTRPPEEGSYDNVSRSPILLWLNGLEQP